MRFIVEISSKNANDLWESIVTPLFFPQPYGLAFCADGKEVAGFSGPEETAPSTEDTNKLRVEQAVKKTLGVIKLRNDSSDHSLR